MIEVDRYVGDVLRNVQAPATERQRIEADLRAHLEEAVRAGEPVEAAIARMGSPAEVAGEFMSQMALPYASLWRRLAAFVVDAAIIGVAVAVLAGLAVIVSALVPLAPQGLDYVVGAIYIALIGSFSLAGLGIFLLYFPIQEGRFGQTPGKHLLKLWVRKESGLPIDYKEAFLRRISFYFDFLVVDALFIPFTAKRQRAFDMVARTVVVEERAQRS